MQNSRLCWICEKNVADTSEHALKKSDIQRAYGKGDYNKLGERQPYHYKDGKESKLQGANSDLIKNPKDLCKHCNNTLSQPFDRAYDKFISHIISNSDQILEKRFIDFEEVYGEDFPIKQTNLFKYFIKSFGCRIYANPNFSVPQDIIRILNNHCSITNSSYKISISINENLTNIENIFSLIGTLDMKYYQIYDGYQKKLGYTYTQHVGWLYINHFYLKPIDPNSGIEWHLNSKIMQIGVFKSLN